MKTTLYVHAIINEGWSGLTIGCSGRRSAPSVIVKVAHEMPIEHKNQYSGFEVYPMVEE